MAIGEISAVGLVKANKAFVLDVKWSLSYLVKKVSSEK